MRKIEFVAGYYEWLLLVDGQLVWVEGDITELLFERDNDYQEYFNGQILASDLQALVDDEIVEYIRYQSIDAFNHNDTQEWFTEEMVDILKSLTDEEWEEVYRAVYNGYARHYGVVDRRFKYGNYEFEAVGNILGGYKNRVNKITSESFNNFEKFDRKEFYKVAKKNHCSVDVYRIIGDWDNFYMLGNTTFSKVKIDKDLKPCDNYAKWYR